MIADVNVFVVDSNPNYTNAAQQAFDNIGVGSRCINSGHQARNFLLNRGSEITIGILDLEKQDDPSKPERDITFKYFLALDIPYIIAQRLNESHVCLSAFKHWDWGEMTSFSISGDKADVDFWYKLWDLIIIGHGATHNSSRCVSPLRGCDPKDWDSVMREMQRDQWSPFNVPKMLAWQKTRLDFKKNFGEEINSSRIKKFVR